MNQNQMLIYVKNLISNACNGTPFTELPLKSIERKVTTKLPNTSIYICFPGFKRKAAKPDYLVQLDKNNNRYDVRHDEIMRALYDFVIIDPLINGMFAEMLLAETYDCWDDINLTGFSNIKFNSFTIEELVECICYIAIQEEINYPQTNNALGLKRPFISYVEAIYAANGSGLITIEKAIERANFHGRIEPIVGIPYGKVIK